MSTPTRNSLSAQEDTDINLSQMSQGLRNIIASAGWEFKLADGEAYDCDLCCFMLGKDNLTREDEDFVFYNNPNGAQLAVKHLGDDRAGADAVDDEAIQFDFETMSFEIWRVVFVVSIYQGDERDQHLGKMRELTFRIENGETNAEIIRFSIDNTNLDQVTAVRVAEIYRNGSEWFLVKAGDPIPGGLAEAARQYGIQISSTT